MKLKYNEADMHAQLVRMLYPDEKVLFPVYCVFREKSFLPSFLEYGYIAVTDKDRLLTVRSILLTEHSERVRFRL